MSDDLFDKKAKFFDLWAPNYDFLLTTIFYQAIHRRILDYIELPDRPLVLDLGCGTGRLLDRLAARFPTLMGTGLDLSREMLRQARQRNQHHPQLIFVSGNAEALPFAESQFDAVFNTISLLHYPDADRVFAQVSRVLKDRGRFYLADYIAKPTRLFSLIPGGLTFYTPQQREQLGAKVGLQCVGHYPLLLGVWLTIFASEEHD